MEKRMNKKELIEHDTYIESIEELDIDVCVYEAKSSYLVSTTFSNPSGNYKDLVILVVDEKELEVETDKIYPSVGIVGNFNNQFVTNAANKKTTHSTIKLDYESNEVSEGVLIYLEYNDNGKKCIVHLNVKAELNISK